jgi:chemotaxis protein MotB
MRKNEEEKEKENSERWLLTYSDMITLLLVLFIMMYTISTVDTNKFKAISQQLNIMLGDSTSVAADSGIQGSNDEVLNSFDNLVTESPSPSPSSTKTPIAGTRQSIEDELQNLVNSSGLGTVVTVQSEQRGVVVSFQEALLFPSGSADINREGKTVLAKVADIINSVDNYISVEGSTDNVPIRSSRFPSNWELASQRAINVLKQLVGFGVHSTRISATSYGQYRPVTDNSSGKGKARNRRVDIVFIDQEFNSLQAGYEDQSSN